MQALENVILKGALALFLGCVPVGMGATAHDHYPPDCCNETDCKIVPCGDILQLGDGRWQHGQVRFSANNVRRPIDDRCHVCEWGTIGRCVFFPMPSMS